MRFSIIAAATTLLSAVMAQQAFITAPIGTTQWTAPGPQTIKWNLNSTAKTVALSVDLFKGDPTHQTLVQNLGQSTAGASSFQATFPKLPSDWYSIRVGDSWSHYFIVKGDGAIPTGGAPTAPTTAAPAPTTAAPAATSTGVASATTAAPTPTSIKTSGANLLSAAPAAMAVVAAAAALVF